MEGILQWGSWQAAFKYPYSKFGFSSYSIQSCETYLSENKITSTAHSSSWVVDTSFNDAVDELFQHTLTAHMLVGTCRFVIYTKFHVWIHWSWWLLEKHNFSLFCNLHGLSWRGSFGNAVDKQVQHTLIQIFVFLHILYKAVTLNYLKTKLPQPHIVLQELWRDPSMMLLTSCFSIPCVLECQVTPSDL